MYKRDGGEKGQLRNLHIGWKDVTLTQGALYVSGYEEDKVHELPARKYREVFDFAVGLWEKS